MEDYETLYYDLLYKNKQLEKENKKLKEEMELLKKYSKNGNIKQFIYEIIRSNNETRNNKYRNS